VPGDNDDPESGRPIWGYDFQYRRQRYRDAGYSTKAEAVIAEQKAREEIMQGRPLVPARTCTLPDLSTSFFECRAREKAFNTADKEKRRFPAISAFLGARKIQSYTDADIHAFVQHRLKQGVCNRTINLDLSLLRNLFDYAIMQGYAVRNPADMIKNLPELKRKKKIPTDSELVRYLSEIEKVKNGDMVAVFIRLRCFTAMRPSEAYYLEWADIDFEMNHIYLRSKSGHSLKDGEDRVIDLHSDLKKVLLEWKMQWAKVMEDAKDRFDNPVKPIPRHDWIFFHPRNPTKRLKEFKRVIVSAREKAGLPWLNSYTFRHYGISKMLMAGIDRFTVQQWTGHKSSKMFDEVYGHLQPDHGAPEMAKLKLPI